MRALQFLAGAILLGALGGGAMLLRRADTPAAEPVPRSPKPVAATPSPLPPPTPIASPPPTPFVVRQILDLKKPLRHGDYVWNESAAPQGPVVITVDLAAQVVSIFRDGYEIGTAAIIYGADNMPTPLGVFPILQKDADHVSNLYDAPMPYMMRLTDDGITIHATSVKNGFASHGCIGLPLDFAQKVFANAHLGDKVYITRGKQVGLGDSLVD